MFITDTDVVAVGMSTSHLGMGDMCGVPNGWGDVGLVASNQPFVRPLFAVGRENKNISGVDAVCDTASLVDGACGSLTSNTR